VTTQRFRRSSVRAVFETVVQEHAVTAALHDELWAVLWNRRYEDVDEPVWGVGSAYTGILVFARELDAHTTLAGVDTLESFLVFRAAGAKPPVGSRVRVLSANADRWRFADVRRLGLGIELRFDDPTAVADPTWLATLRAGVQRLGELLDARRAELGARRAQLGPHTEPPSVTHVWRENVAAIDARAALATEYTPQEHRSLARARAKGARAGAEEEHRIVMARRLRYVQHRDAEVERFRAGEWPPVRDRVAAARSSYEAYRDEVIRIEDALQRLRSLTERALRATEQLDDLERAELPVRSFAFDEARLEGPAYAQELLRSIELLHAAIPPRSASNVAHFSAYRAPTAGPSVIPPRY
jgi:hypothetical protein